MKRKLIKQGGGGYTIYLPKKWLDQYQLEQGAEVAIEIVDDTLLVKPGGEHIKSETSITMTNLSESAIRTLITNAYRAGYEIITVTFEEQEQFEILQQVIRTRLIGFDVVRQAEKSCVIENITEPSSEQFETLIRKIFYNIDELFAITRHRLKGEPAANYHDVEERIQKYDNFCRRVLAKKKVGHNRSELLWTFLAIILHAQREIYHLNRYLDRKEQRSEEGLVLLNEIQQLFELLRRAYIDRDVSLLARVHELHAELFYENGYNLLDQGKECIILYHLLSSLKNFYLCNSPLAGYLM